MNKEKTCKGCTDRHEACHVTCEEYKKRKADIVATNTRRKAIKAYEQLGRSKRCEKLNGQL